VARKRPAESDAGGVKSLQAGNTLKLGLNPCAGITTPCTADLERMPGRRECAAPFRQGSISRNAATSAFASRG